MCGRFSLHPQDFPKLIDKAKQLQLSFSLGDVYPGQSALVIRTPRRLDVMQWGYPGIMDHKMLINARSETVTHKQMFAHDYQQRRCVILASGYYEWSKDKHCFLIQDKTKQPLLLGGFWQTENNHKRFIILTREAVGETSQIHHRMPVLIEPQYLDVWLSTTRPDLRTCISPVMLFATQCQ